MAEPTILGIADTYGIELLHPIREGRSKRQVGKKGKSSMFEKSFFMRGKKRSISHLPRPNT
jgi:hypothetical protein